VATPVFRSSPRRRIKVRYFNTLCAIRLSRSSRSFAFAFLLECPCPRWWWPNKDRERRAGQKTAAPSPISPKDQGLGKNQAWLRVLGGLITPSSHAFDRRGVCSQLLFDGNTKGVRSENTMTQPIKSVYRSANISLRKADLARASGQSAEQLFQLESFVKTVRHTLKRHPLFARRKDDPEAVTLVQKLPEVVGTVRAMGGDVSSSEDDETTSRADEPPPPPPPLPTRYPTVKASTSAVVAVSRTEDGDTNTAPPMMRRRQRAGSSLLARSRADSRANSRAASPGTSDDESERGGRQQRGRDVARDGRDRRDVGRDGGDGGRVGGRAATVPTKSATSGEVAARPDRSFGNQRRVMDHGTSASVGRRADSNPVKAGAAKVRAAVGSSTEDDDDGRGNSQDEDDDGYSYCGSDGGNVKTYAKPSRRDSRDAAAAGVRNLPRASGSSGLRGAAHRPRKSSNLRDSRLQPEPPGRTLSDSEAELSPPSRRRAGASADVAKAKGASREASPSSAEKYGRRVEEEVARLREEAEAQRIVSLERKIETMRARLDANAARTLGGATAPTHANAGGATTVGCTAAVDGGAKGGKDGAVRKLLLAPVALASAVAVGASAKSCSRSDIMSMQAQAELTSRLGSVELELYKLRQHITEAAATQSIPNASGGGGSNGGSGSNGGGGSNGGSGSGGGSFCSTAGVSAALAPPLRTGTTRPREAAAALLVAEALAAEAPTAVLPGPGTGPGSSLAALQAERELHAGTPGRSGAPSTEPVRRSNSPGAWIRRGEAEVSPSAWNMHGGARLRSSSPARVTTLNARDTLDALSIDNTLAPAASPPLPPPLTSSSSSAALPHGAVLVLAPSSAPLAAARQLPPAATMAMAMSSAYFPCQTVLENSQGARVWGGEVLGLSPVAPEPSAAAAAAAADTEISKAAAIIAATTVSTKQAAAAEPSTPRGQSTTRMTTTPTKRLSPGAKPNTTLAKSSSKSVDLSLKRSTPTSSSSAAPPPKSPRSSKTLATTAAFKSPTSSTRLGTTAALHSPRATTTLGATAAFRPPINSPRSSTMQGTTAAFRSPSKSPMKSPLQSPRALKTGESPAALRSPCSSTKLRSAAPKTSAAKLSSSSSSKTPTKKSAAATVVAEVAAAAPTAATTAAMAAGPVKPYGTSSAAAAAMAAAATAAAASAAAIAAIAAPALTVMAPAAPKAAAPAAAPTPISSATTAAIAIAAAASTVETSVVAARAAIPMPPPTPVMPPVEITAPPLIAFPMMPPVDAYNGLAAAAAAAAMGSSPAHSTPATNANMTLVTGPKLATMEGAQAAAVAAAEAAAAAVGQRVQRELRGVSERQDALSRRAQAEMDAVINQVLPLYEDTSNLRITLGTVETRLDAVELYAAAADGAGNAGGTAAAAAAAAAAAVAADMMALRGQVARQQTASQEWTEAAIVQQGHQHWDHVQQLLSQRDREEQERAAGLQRQLEAASDQQRAWQLQVQDRGERQEAVADQLRRQVLEAQTAVQDLKVEMARQAEHMAGTGPCVRVGSVEPTSKHPTSVNLRPKP